MILKLYFVIVLCLFFEAAAESEGDICTQDDTVGSISFGIGTYLRSKSCYPDRYKPLQNFDEFPNPVSSGDHIVCCTTPHASNQEDTCAPIWPTMTAVKTGRKAWDKCIEYQEELVYPCEQSEGASEGMVRANHCKHKHNTDNDIRSKAADQDEFPHMVLLGYEQPDGSTPWNCGGTLLSDRFILTAAQCTDKQGRQVTHASVGSVKRPKTVNSPLVYRIKRIITHPEYRTPCELNDIALLETETKITLGPSVVPACLDVIGGEADEAIKTDLGYYFSLDGGDKRTLLKMTMTKSTDEYCQSLYCQNQNPLAIPPRFDASRQLCYWNFNFNSPDACHAGAPLTIKNPVVYCMYSVIGISSISPCDPRSYHTKVAFYVPWIESIVWP